MTAIVDWASERARMILAFVALTIIVGTSAYVGLPKEGEPDIEVPILFVSVPFPGISAADSERLLVKPIETGLADIDGLKTITGTALENYAGVMLEFEFGWDRTKVMADVRDAMNSVEADFPAGADKYSVDEINFSEFPIVIVNLTGNVPERSLTHLAQDLKDDLEGIDAVLEVQLTGYRDEMLEVVIDPLKLEAYNVTAGELINVVVSNNQMIAAGEVATASGANAVKIPSSFDDVSDIYGLPVKVNGDSVVTLGDLADIRLTFEDRAGTARFNGETAVSLQVVKRKGFNLIDTVAEVREVVAAAQEDWPQPLQDAVALTLSNDTSYRVESMVNQLENSVITAIALVMIVIMASLGMRSALLVGFAIPTSFMLTFALFAALGYPVNNIVMFGLILSVGMLVDGAIVVVEYADKRMKHGVGPMHAYVEAARRMFWPIVSSTATTLCAFLPMLFWPGVPGEFMAMLPTTLIFVLSASLVVALVYLPIVGGVAGRMSRLIDNSSNVLRPLPLPVRAALVAVSAAGLFVAAMQVLNPDYLFPGGTPLEGALAFLPGLALFVMMSVFTVLTLDAIKLHRPPKSVQGGYRRTPFGRFTSAIATNPVMPIVAVVAVLGFVGLTLRHYGEHNLGVEFFADVEPERAIIYIQGRGNLSVEEKDAMVRAAEDVVLGTPGIQSTFAYAGKGGLNQNTGGAMGPRDQIGQIQIEMEVWENRPYTIEPIKLFGLIPFERKIVDPTYSGKVVVETLERELAKVPGLYFEVLEIAGGPAPHKPVHLRLKGEDLDALTEATALASEQFHKTAGLTDIQDTRPRPGIDWQLDVDVKAAGRYGTNVATVGGMVQLVTTGLLLDTMRIEDSDEEIEIRVRLPEQDRVLATLDTLKLRTPTGLVPLSNFVTRTAVPTLAQIERVDQSRHLDLRAGVEDDLVRLQEGEDDEGALYTTEEADALVEAAGADAYIRTAVTPTERIERITEWLETEPFPTGVTWEWTGGQEEQEKSKAFLVKAFLGALFMMFIILLAQFNSFYNAVLVLLAVVLSTAGVLVGMMVMSQPFSIIMTGTGIVALAGIVVNNNIVLIDTYQEYSTYMPRLEAIVRTAETRIRPVLLTTITTMAGLAPMMFGLSLNFFEGGYSIDAPTALWWKQLATAVVFGLGIATVLTLVFTPAMLALRVWITAGAYRSVKVLQGLMLGRDSHVARDAALRRDFRCSISTKTKRWKRAKATPRRCSTTSTTCCAPMAKPPGPNRRNSPCQRRNARSIRPSRLWARATWRSLKRKRPRPTPRTGPPKPPNRPHEPSGRAFFRGLVCPHGSIFPALRQQCLVASGFRHHAVFQHEYPVGIDDGREAVGNGYHRAPLPHGLQRELDVALRLAVERRGGLVEQQDRRILQKRARNADPLLFAARKLQPALAHGGLVAFRQRDDEVVDLRRLRRFHDLGKGRVGLAVGDVVADRVVEQNGVLRHHANRSVQARLRHRAQVLPVDPNRPAVHIVEAKQQPPDGRLARPGRPHQRHRLPRSRVKRQPLQDRPRGIVAEGDILEHDPPTADLQVRRAGRVRHFGGLFEQAKHLVHIDQRLPDLAVDRAEEIERHGDLHHVGVDHHEVAHRERALLHAARRHQHHRDEARSHDEPLPGIQHGQGLRRADRRAFVARHRGIVTHRLAPFGPEIFHRLEIEQRIDCFLMRVGVLVDHPLADLDPPFCHREGEPDVKADGRHHHHEIPGIEQNEENARHHEQFEKQRPDAEQQETQEKFDALDAPLHDAAQAARLAGEVKAQRERMDVAEGLQRQRPERPLRHPREDDIAQLLEADCQETRDAIGHREADCAGRQHPGGGERDVSRQRIDRRLVIQRRDDRDHFCQQKQEHGHHDAGAHRRLPLGPEVGRHTSDRAPPLSCLRSATPHVCLLRSGTTPLENMSGRPPDRSGPGCGSGCGWPRRCDNTAPRRRSGFRRWPRACCRAGR